MEEYTEAFEEFWTKYPRRIAKPAAFKAWQKNKIEADHFLSTIIRQDLEKRTRLKWWSKDSTKIPHPATWLNQKRWQDENWEADVKENKSVPAVARYQPIDPGPEMSVWAKWANRILLRYLRASGGLDDFNKAVLIKNEVVKETSTAMYEDIAAGVPYGECFLLITEMLLDRLDLELKLSLKKRVLT